MTFSDTSKGAKQKSKHLFCQPEKDGFLKMKVGNGYQWMRFTLEEGLLYSFNGSRVS